MFNLGTDTISAGAYDTPACDCPYCGASCEADWVDIGVGMVQGGPYHCLDCGASEASPHDSDRETREDYDREFGWYKPGSPAGSSANTDADGNIIPCHEADTQYRASHGVAARYDANGKLIVDHEPKPELFAPFSLS